MDDYTKMKNEIARLHKVCRAKDNLLSDSLMMLRLLINILHDKLSSETVNKVDELVKNISENLG